MFQDVKYTEQVPQAPENNVNFEVASGSTDDPVSIHLEFSNIKLRTYKVGELMNLSPALNKFSSQKSDFSYLCRKTGVLSREAIMALLLVCPILVSKVDNQFRVLAGTRMWAIAITSLPPTTKISVLELKQCNKSARLNLSADRPFALGYRISVEEGNEGGLRITDSLQLIDRLIDGGVSYVHASLGSALDQRPVDDTSGRTIVRILHDYIAGRVPLIAAGQIRTAEQAERAIDEGLSLVALGQGLVMNPDWVAHARVGRDSDVKLSVSFQDVARLTIPQRLWTIIEDTPGWFNVLRNQAERQAI